MKPIPVKMKTKMVVLSSLREDYPERRNIAARLLWTLPRTANCHHERSVWLCASSETSGLDGSYSHMWHHGHR